MFEKHRPARRLREVAYGIHGSASKEETSENHSSTDGKRYPEERGNERKEAPDLSAANNQL